MLNILPDIEKRNFGLDLFRLSAILIVVLGHGFHFFGLKNYISYISVDGVDLFFVLSGFLIGRILIKIKFDSYKQAFKEILTFLKRRWLRTLPNYFLFLIFNILMLCAGIYDGILNINTLAYFAFLQNFKIPLDLMFWESWSLAVEEWFYLIFPVLLMVMYCIGRLFKVKINLFLCSVILFIIIPLVLRISFCSSQAASINADLFIRKIVIYRLDTIAWGLLTAFLFSTQQKIILKHSLLLFVIGVSGITLMNNVLCFDNFMFNNTVYFSLQSLFIACLIPLFFKTGNPGKLVKGGTAFISLISYSMYLVHLPVLYLIKFTGFEYTYRHEKILLMLFYLIITISVSAIVYSFWERPFLSLRDRK